MVSGDGSTRSSATCQLMRHNSVTLTRKINMSPYHNSIVFATGSLLIHIPERFLY